MQEKVQINEILDMFNSEVGYKGLDNTGKITDERDDVITRQSFNNWVRAYNATHSRKIKSRIIDQYNNEWFRSDIEKLIQDKTVQKKLKHAYLRNTVPLFEEWESMGLLSNQRVSKKYKSEQNKQRGESNGESLALSIKEMMNFIIDEVLGHHFSVSFNDEKVDVRKYINRSKIIEDFIDIRKVEEEAFDILDHGYGTPEYDSDGEIIHIHNSKERKKTESFLKA